MVETTHSTGLWPGLTGSLRQFGSRVADWIAPASEASTDGDAYRIALELPGVEEGDIELTAHDGAVTVTGEKKTERSESGETWYFSERQYGSFSRSFRLPPDADASGVGADLKDGVLTITVPKKTQAEAKPTPVKIRRG